MHDVIRLELEKWGLPASEAQAYLALIRNGALGASGVASAIGIPRTSVYPILESLLQKGLVETGAGVGSRFTAVRPKEALPSLMVREREELLHRDRLTANLVKQVESLAEPFEHAVEAEQIQVIRDPRVFAERFERLQEEAKQQIDVFIKAPILNPSYSNPTQEKAMRRRVRYRGLYESAIVHAPEINPYLSKWIAGGESARVHEGELPHKLAIFDRQSVLIPLVPPRPGRILFLSVKQSQLAASLGMLFDFLWEHAKPIACETRNASRKRSRNSDADDGNSERRSPTRARPSGRNRTN